MLSSKMSRMQLQKEKEEEGAGETDGQESDRT